jgi:hypothetical protein
MNDDEVEIEDEIKMLRHKIKQARLLRKYKDIELPNRLVVFKNPDKWWHEKWTPGRKPSNFPHPYRAVLLGKPNSGKTLIIHNLIMRAKPGFRRILVIHCDGGQTKEYDGLGCEISGSIPSPESFNGEEKTLVILDDLCLKKMDKDQLQNLDRLFGYVSTHRNVSVILTSQDCFNVPSICRRCANVWMIYKTADSDSLQLIGKRAGMNKDVFRNVFQEIVKGHHDSLWIDTTDNTPYPLRLNGFELLRVKDKTVSVDTE